MVTKTLTIMEDAYGLLLEQKRSNESFSEEIRRIVGRSEFPPASRIFKKVLSDEDALQMKREVIAFREESIRRLQRQKV